MSEPIYANPVIAQRIHGNPRPQLDAQGYTVRAGSPTCHQVQLEGETKWRRVYVWQFSNVGTCFVRIKGVPHIVRL